MPKVEIIYWEQYWLHFACQVQTLLNLILMEYMKLLTHPPIATNIHDFGTPTFDFGIKPRKLNISTKAHNNVGDVDTPDFEPGSDSIIECYCGGQYNSNVCDVGASAWNPVWLDFLAFGGGGKSDAAHFRLWPPMVPTNNKVGR